MDTSEHFSATLARIRKQRGLSQRQLAEMTGTSYRMICHYETKASAVPMNKLKALAEALNVRIADLFDEDEVLQLETMDVRLFKKMQEIQTLSEADRKELNQHINSLLEKSRLKKSQSEIA
jgi:DNA phosphorothioation-dependent restriction protein DptG